MNAISSIVIAGLGITIASGQIHTSITTDKAEYQVGEPIEIFLTVHNTGQDTETFTWADFCQATYYIDSFRYPPECVFVPSQIILPPDSSHTWHWTHAAAIYDPGEGVHFIRGELIEYPWLSDNTTIAVGDIQLLNLVEQTLLVDTCCSPPNCDTSYIDVMISKDTVTFYWKTPELNTCLEPMWSGWLSADTFHVVMMDIGPPCDCVSCFVLTASFAPFPIGPYTLDFWNGYYDYPTFIVDTTIIAIQTNNPRLTGFALSRNYPNPFNPATRIVYSLPRSDYVTLKVYDLRGRVVQTLVSEYQLAGEHTLYFDAGPLPSGIYFYQLQAGGWKESRKMVVMR